MSISYTVEFFRKPTEAKHAAYVKAAEALAEAGVTTLPDELATYFEVGRPSSVEPEEKLRVGEIDMQYTDQRMPGDVEKALTVDNECGRQVDIDLETLPDYVSVIRVRLS